MAWDQIEVRWAEMVCRVKPKVPDRNARPQHVAQPDHSKAVGS